MSEPMFDREVCSAAQGEDESEQLAGPDGSLQCRAFQLSAEVRTAVGRTGAERRGR